MAGVAGKRGMERNGYLKSEYQLYRIRASEGGRGRGRRQGRRQGRRRGSVVSVLHLLNRIKQSGLRKSSK